MGIEEILPDSGGIGTVNTEEKVFEALEQFKELLGHYPTKEEWDENKEEIGVTTRAGHLKRNTGMGLAEAKDMVGADKSRYQHSGEQHTLTEEMKEPSPEKAYIVGVLLGDGSLGEYTRTIKFTLQTKDKEFVDEVSRCLSEWIKQGSDVTISKLPKRGDNQEPVYSLSKGSSEPFEELMRLYNMDPTKFPDEFEGYEIELLRGLWDSEGHISQGIVGFTNTDEEILELYYVLLQNIFGWDSDDMSLYETNKETQAKQIRMRKKHTEEFVETVQPTITRKFGGNI